MWEKSTQYVVLGPVLFKWYVNDIPPDLGSNCLMYADDLRM